MNKKQGDVGKPSVERAKGVGIIKDMDMQALGDVMLTDKLFEPGNLSTNNEWDCTAPIDWRHKAMDAKPKPPGR